jgi:hypothetical protein
MSAYKIVQTIPSLATAGTAVTSNPIALKSGYLRIVPEQNSYVDVSANPGINTSTGVYISAGQEFIWKENIGSQNVVGIITGTTTTIKLPEGQFTEFSVGDYVQLTGVSPSGINTNFTTVATVNTSLDPTTGGYSRVLTLNWNTSSQGPVTIPIGEIRKVVKVAALASSGNVHITEVQIAGG